jgi:hypothetical protein
MRSRSEDQRLVTGVSAARRTWPSGLDRAAAAVGDDDGQVVVIVLVAVTVAAAIDQHAMIEQGAVTLGDALQSLEQVGQFRRCEIVNLAHLADLP